jgi:GNAT superfamily N-acetyltransferase
MKLLRIRAMTRADLDMAIEWAAAEGWNPGLHDADTFLAADPGGFLLGLLESEPVATISAVRYGAHFGFIGFYIVRPESRGQGHGIALWRHAMERLAGRDLYSIRKTEKFISPERCVKIAIQVLDALEVIHKRNVIHRDLKSANIYIEGPDERVKLLDLGFAKASDDLKLTSPNALLGTPFYISPEQYIDPTTVDARADLFSLGIVMFEVLTGEWPYTYDSKRDLLSKVMFGQLERHPAAKRDAVPPWLDQVVARALALDREKRYEDAAAMRAALMRKPTKSGIFRRLFGKS